MTDAKRGDMTDDDDEALADSFCAEPQPDWLEIAHIEEDATALAKRGELGKAAIRDLIARARAAIPDGFDILFANIESSLREKSR